MIDDYLRDDSMQEFEIFCCEGRGGRGAETEERNKLRKEISRDFISVGYSYTKNLSFA